MTFYTHEVKVYHNRNSNSNGVVTYLKSRAYSSNCE